MKSPKFSESAELIASERYAQEGDENLEDIFERVAEGLSGVEYIYMDDKTRLEDMPGKIQDEFYNAMIEKKLIPAGRTLTNSGTERGVVANCVVLPIEDSMDGIGSTLHKAMLLQQQGCGLGFDFSSLRPAGFSTKYSQGLASGPVSFMKIYNNVFSTIKQQSRHGANMGMLRIDHPDILDFITCKQVEGDIKNFNISVLVTEEFMLTLLKNPHNIWKGRFEGKDYSLRNIKHKEDMFGSHEIVEEVEITVGHLWQVLCQAAHSNGEPGVAFVDTVNKYNPLPGLGPITCSNPCGEQMLHAYDNCNLMSINLAEFYLDSPIDDKIDRSHIDWDELEKTVFTGIHMLDNTIDLFDHKVEEINKMAKANRRVGLGVMGFADLLFKLKIRYGSKQSLELAELLMEHINSCAYQASVKLGKKRGRFSNWKNSIYSERGDHLEKSIRNAARTSIAPTGSISMLFDVNSGIEPYFSLAYKKKIRMGTFDYVSSDFLKALESHEEYTEKSKDEILGHLMKGLTLSDIHRDYIELPHDLIDVFVTSMEINPLEHVRMQAAFQKNTNNSISKTINLPKKATVEDIMDIYRTAWELECRSITVYRDGSREVQVLNTGKDKQVEEEVKPLHVFHGIIERPRSVAGKTTMIRTAHGNMYVTVNSWDYDGEDRPYEVFVHIGKEGGDLHSYMSALTRTISMSLRSGVPASEVVNQLRGISCHANWHDGQRNEGPVDAIAQVLSKFTDLPEASANIEAKKPLVAQSVITSEMASEIINLCPSCLNGTVMQEGCETCNLCGWSKC